MGYNKYKDYEKNLEVSKILTDTYDWIEDITVKDYEDYDIDDISITYKGKQFPVEVKEVTFADVNPNSDNCVDCTYWKKNTASALPSGITIDNIEIDCNDIQNTVENGTHQYMKDSDHKYYYLNAASIWAGVEKTKTYKLFINKKSNLILKGKDGILLFNHSALEKALYNGGYILRYQEHFKEDGDEMKAKGKENKSWEYKAVIDLSFANRFIPYRTDDEKNTDNREMG